MLRGAGGVYTVYVHIAQEDVHGVQKGVQRPGVGGAGGLPAQDCLQFVSH